MIHPSRPFAILQSNFYREHSRRSDIHPKRSPNSRTIKGAPSEVIHDTRKSSVKEALNRVRRDQFHPRSERTPMVAPPRANLHQYRCQPTPKGSYGEFRLETRVNVRWNCKGNRPVAAFTPSGLGLGGSYCQSPNANSCFWGEIPAPASMPAPERAIPRRIKSRSTRRGPLHRHLYKYIL
jgi:hypothetical protein